MDKQLNRFLDLFIAAVNNVDECYLNTVYENIEAIRNGFTNYYQRFLTNDRFVKPGERIFCYELYHQLRILIDAERNENKNFLEGTYLQAEIKKMQIYDLLQTFGITPLTGSFVPDLLMHSPGNANSHPYVIEIKATPFVLEVEVLADLCKIGEFLNKYNYEKGIFLAVNLGQKTLTDLIKSAFHNGEKNYARKPAALSSFRELHNVLGDITIITRERGNAKAETISLIQALNV